MKKLYTITILFLFTLLATTTSYAFDVPSEWDGNPSDQSDYTGDGYIDLVFTASNIDGTELVFYIPDLEDINSQYDIELWASTTLRATVTPSYQGWVLFDVEDHTTYTDIDKVVLVFYNSMLHIYDSDTFTAVYGVAQLTEDTFFWDTLTYEESLGDEDNDQAFSRGFNSGVRSVDAIVDEDGDGFDDDSWDDGSATGYALAYDESGGSLEWVKTFFTLFDVIFEIELLPGLSIATILGITLIPPIVIGVIKWLS